MIAIFFCHFRATPEAYRGSQAGGLVGAVAAGLLQPLQCQNLNPLSKARDQTRNLRVSSQIHFFCARKGMLYFCFFFFFRPESSLYHDELSA